MSDKEFIMSSENIPTEEELNSLERSEAVKLLKNISTQLSVYEQIEKEKDLTKKGNPIVNVLVYIVFAAVGAIGAGILFIVLDLLLRLFFSKDPAAYIALFTSVGLYLFLIIFLPIAIIKNQKKIKNHLNEFYSNEVWFKDSQLFTEKIVSLMGPDYSASHIVDRFSNYFLNGRCSTLQEAKNIYTQELANEKLNAVYAEAAAEAHSANEAARLAAKRASHARTMSFFNFFK